MKTDEEIKDDIYHFIEDSELKTAVSGVIKKTRRPAGSDKEDIIISVLENGHGQIQEAIVNVNIYVADNIRDGQAEEDTIRCRQLSRIAADLLEVGRGDGFRFILDRQRVMPVNGKDEHFINNRLLYKQVNE